MKKIIKFYLKLILRRIGLKLIKINFKKPKAFPYHPPSLNNINYIIKSRGIFHFGAHRGSEAAVYEWFGKKVLWVEALPEIFLELEDNIRKHYNQKAINVVLGDENKKVDFYISNRDASSSSIFDFSDKVKKKIFFKDQDLIMQDKIQLQMKKLDTLLDENNILANEYDHWVVDLQGAELKFLKGAENSIKYCKSMNIEISKIELYNGGVQFEELKKFLELKNFSLVDEPIGEHLDVLFVRNEKI